MSYLPVDADIFLENAAQKSQAYPSENAPAMYVCSMTVKNQI